MFDLRNLRGDLLGGVTTGIIALPLALAFGESSGLGPIAGVWGAIILGFFAALLGGTPTLISGPTGPIVVVFAGIYSAFSQQPALIFTTVLLSGLMQIAFGFLRFGQYVKLVPYPVISGVMSGIGFIIISLQLVRLLGSEPEASGTVGALSALPGAVANPNWFALGLGLLAVALVFLWPKPWGRYVPGSLVALVVGTLLALALPGGAVPTLGTIPTGFPPLTLPEFSRENLLLMLEFALVLAVLGSIDSLTSALVADNLTRSRHDSDRELIGQGVGNALCGLFGAVPGAGATMRTVVNIRSGSTTRISGMTHALLLLAVVLLFAPQAAFIPHAVLAGILIKVGFDIIDFDFLRRARRGPRWDLLLMVVVLGMTVFVDLLAAVGVGVVLAALAFVKRLADAQMEGFQAETPALLDSREQSVLEASGGRVLLLDFVGPLSFSAASDLVHLMRERARGEVRALVLDLTRKPFMDASAVRAVETIVGEAEAQGIEVFLAGASEEVSRLLREMQADREIEADHRFAQRLPALQAALAVAQR